MFDQGECKENGSKKASKTFFQLFVRRQGLLRINLTELYYYRERQKKTLCMQAFSKLCHLQQAKSLRHP